MGKVTEKQIMDYIKENPGTCHGQYLVRIFGDEAHEIISKLQENRKIKYFEGFVITGIEYVSDGKRLKEVKND